jgi:hypothetical protein
MINMTLPGDNFYSGPQSKVGAALGVYQGKPVAPSDWDSAKPLGGPASAPGGFPR